MKKTETKQEETKQEESPNIIFYSRISTELDKEVKSLEKQLIELIKFSEEKQTIGIIHKKIKK